MSDLEASRALVKALQSELAAALSEIEALRWLVEVMSLYADECCNLLFVEYRQCACDELRAIYKKALSDADYGGRK